MRVRLFTNHRVAIDSIDHLKPGGTMHDNSRNHAFNEKLYKLFKKKPLTIVDLGCSGGGFVKDCVDDGHEAFGLEGSDYSITWDGPGGTEEERARRKPGRRAEWATIPERLFTCDISKPFVLTDIFKQTLGVDVFTAWEVIEHISHEGLLVLSRNVHRHLAIGGLWIMSVSQTNEESHLSVHDKAWWENFWWTQGFKTDENKVRYFHEDWIRGPLQRAEGSFHFVLHR